MTTKSPAFIAVVTYANGSAAAVRFASMTDLHDWEDAHPEVEVVSSMPLVSRNLAEQASA